MPASTPTTRSATSSSHREGRLPEVARADSGHARGRSRDVPHQSVRPHQGLAAQRLPADRGRRAGAEPQSGRTTSPRSSRLPSTRATSFRAWAIRRTRCCRARLISYPDAHRYRVGVNYDSLPVNAPKCPFATYHRDGSCASTATAARPELRAQQLRWPDAGPAYMERPITYDSATVERYDHREWTATTTPARQPLPPDEA